MGLSELGPFSERQALIDRQSIGAQVAAGLLVSAGAWTCQERGVSDSGYNTSVRALGQEASAAQLMQARTTLYLKTQ